MEESQVVLLSWWPSMYGIRVPIALAEKGIQYEYREEDLPHNKSPLLLNLNPVHKKIPVLIHNGKPICESNVIVHYIDETWKDESPLLPSDPYLRAQARFWADYIDKKVYDTSRKIWTSKGEELERASKEFIDLMKLLEGQLGDKPYFMGETFGYVDILLIAYKSHFYSYETIGNFSLEKECAKLTEWIKRCTKRASVSKSLPDPHKLYELTLEARNNLG